MVGLALGIALWAALMMVGGHPWTFDLGLIPFVVVLLGVPAAMGAALGRALPGSART